ncbi:RNA pseudouridylate synthase domain-containing protein 1 isoform X1 [Tachyglossus aculeatus]|uniref:RNA pseudouridylate synthase domain-containing protein 1 isoform X1 n=1 Tax=Tachyglossus aculeatus TaxID=9261 RepID=UPI0018F59945|nr:RNA pseudouridylate synthase domain-containing protein 1 isoform X1 [Tachyglossus aculeatus]
MRGRGTGRHGPGEPRQPVGPVPERRFRGGEQAVGPPPGQQAVAPAPHPAGPAEPALPRPGRPRHLPWLQILPPAGLLHQRGPVRGPQQGRRRQSLPVLQGADRHQGLRRPGKGVRPVAAPRGTGPRFQPSGGTPLPSGHLVHPRSRPPGPAPRRFAHPEGVGPGRRGYGAGVWFPSRSRAPPEPDGDQLAAGRGRGARPGSASPQVRGHVGEDRMTISHAIGKNTAEGLTHTMCIQGTEGCENAKPCRTELWVLEHGTYGGEPVTKVLLQPLTGRTHQLRVHCSASGHPIVGDLTYGLGRDGVPFRMMLHALHLRIPTGPELVEATAPDPFLPSLDSRWVSLRAVRPLGAVLRTLRAAGDGAPAAGRSGTSGRPVGVTDGAERQCRAWLREWAAALEPDG